MIRVRPRSESTLSGLLRRLGAGLQTVRPPRGPARRAPAPGARCGRDAAAAAGREARVQDVQKVLTAVYVDRPGVKHLTTVGGRMTGLEVAALSLGTSVVRSVAKIWLGDRQLAADVTVDAIGLLSNRVTDIFNKRRVQRLFDEMTDVVATKVKPLISSEFRSLPENERLAAVAAVVATFDYAQLTDDDLFANDLDAAYVYRYLRRTVPEVPRQYGLSADATEFYAVILRESCSYLVQVKTGVPGFTPAALTTILQRETEIIAALREVLARLPDQTTQRGPRNFESDYRTQVVNYLDRMEVFGATLSETGRQYPLGIAYISLSVDCESPVPSLRRPRPGRFCRRERRESARD